MHKGLVSAFFIAGVACAAGSPAGAAQDQEKVKSAAAKAARAEVPEPSKEKLTIVGGAPIDPKAYIIGAEDILQIRVWREPELSGDFPVRPDGKISMSLINEVEAAGLTPEKLAGAIGQKLTKFMNEPEVTVGVKQVNSKKYFIQGEVQKPGAYPLTVPTTVLEALVNAGGFRDFANTKGIVILRGATRHKFNYKEVTHGKKMDQNILLLPGDQIIVP